MSPGRFWTGVVGLMVILAITMTAGFWQIDRAGQKRAMQARLDAGRQAPPLQLTPSTPENELVDWRRAQATGRWLPEFTILMNNRNIGDKPGFWVVTPLAFDVPGSPTQVVAVMRGWLPRQMAPASGVPVPVDVTTPAGEQTISGDLVPRVPRLLELDMLSGDAVPLKQRFGQADGPPRLQNFDRDAYAQATGLNLLPTVLQQTSDADDGLQRNWEPPPVNVYTHIGYAVQWFIFAAIAVVALGVLIVRRNRRPAP